MATEYVYLFKAGEYYKIGRTKDVKQRLSSLSLFSPPPPAAPSSTRPAGARSHAEYMAAWAADAAALAELRPRWQREADAAERASWGALPIVKGVEL